MNIDLYALKAFYVLGKTKNYTLCAKKLCITQSAVSHSIKKLERSVNTNLTQKNKRRFALTSEGESLFKTAEKIFFEIEKTEEELAGGQERVKTINLGATVEFGSTVLIKQVRPFMEEHPDFLINFKLTHEPMPLLLSEELDVVVDCKSHSIPSTEKLILFREKYVVIASPRYLKNHSFRKAKDLEACTILSLDKELSWWNNFLFALPGGEKLNFSRIVEINHVRGIINAAVESIGVGFVPKYSVLEKLRDKTLINVFPSLKLLEDKFYIYYKKNRNSFQKIQLFVDYLKKIHPSEFGD